MITPVLPDMRSFGRRIVDDDFANQDFPQEPFEVLMQQAYRRLQHHQHLRAGEEIVAPI